jgi:Tol biopolymer transport system component
VSDLSRWPQADRILDAALDRPAAERRAFVRNAAQGDGDLAAALEAVIAEAETDDEFLAPGGALGGALAADVADAPEPRRLQSGEAFGSYEVVDVIGRGGMGEVYRARDPRLGREVALKVLPSRFAADPDRARRLEQEARLLASLNHPNIAAIYDVEHQDGMLALVLELVDGPTLADRLRRGRLPIDEALSVAAGISEALEAAHRRGIVHRDLKPANVKLTAAGDVKVLDFGIAKALTADPQRRLAGPELPTVADTAARAAGVIIGTVPYVSPERARGQPTDHRADIWSFGCVVYELLTGQRAFAGDTSTEIIARVLERDPDLSKLPRRTPPSLRRLLVRAFAKDPAHRLGYIGDARLDIADARRELAGGTPGDGRTEPWRAVALAGALALVAGIGGGAAAMWSLLRTHPPAPTYVSVAVSDVDELIAGELPGVAIAPDGRTIVYRTRRDDVVQLVRRSLDDGRDALIPDSRGGAAPFFSPDGRWIGYSVEEGLMKVEVGGDRPVPLTGTRGGSSGSWGSDDAIVFSSTSGRTLYRIPAAGGTPEPVTTLDDAAGHLAHESPAVLPGGRRALVTIVTADGSWIGVADFSTGRAVPLVEGRQARYVAPGFVVFARGNALLAGPFDALTGAFTRDPIVVLEDVELGNLNGTAHFDVAADGTLAYMPRRPALGLATPVWVGLDGSEEVIPVEPQAYTRATLSPDGTRIALAVAAPDNRDIWVYDLGRETLMRLTVDPAIDTAPIWSPDSQHIAFRSERQGGGIFLTRADGSGEPLRLTASEGPERPAHTPYSFTPDGGTLLFTELRSYTDQGIARVHLDAPLSVEAIVDGPYAETRPAISPDGRWMAYQSDETGRYEVYVRSWPDVSSERVQVSTRGGTSPRWATDGGAIYFHDGNEMIAAHVRSTPAFAVDRVEPLFEASRFNQRLGPIYDVTADGARFLFLRQGDASGARDRRIELRLIQHWVDSLRARFEP